MVGVLPLLPLFVLPSYTHCYMLPFTCHLSPVIDYLLLRGFVYLLLYIYLGMFSAVTAAARPLLDKDAKKKARDERFSLSKTSKGAGASSGKGPGASAGKGTKTSSGKGAGASSGKGTKASSGKGTGASKTSSTKTISNSKSGLSKVSSSSRSAANSSSGGSSSSGVADGSRTSSNSNSSPSHGGVISDRRKMRLVDGKAALAPSGKFRKTDGYFKKKSSLRPREGKSSRVNSEFSA